MFNANLTWYMIYILSNAVKIIRQLGFVEALLKIKFSLVSIWLLLLGISFGYELPILTLSSVDRLNPRLFDISFIIAIIILYQYRFRINKKNTLFNVWFCLLIWFLFCILTTALLSGFPAHINSYMYYYFFEYLKGLIICACLLTIPINYLEPTKLAKYFLLGGVLTSAYCIYEINFATNVIVLSDSLTIIKPENYVWGPFVGSYFQIAMYLPFVFVLSLALFDKYKNIKYLALAGFFVWPTLYTGSRTHLFMVLVVTIAYILMRSRTIRTRLVVGYIGLSVALLLYFYSASIDVASYETLSRMESLEGNSDHSIIARILMLINFDISTYDNSLLLPFIGGGFYVAPVEGGFRIGYGFHNIYVFIIEQAGFIGLFIFMTFIYVFFKPIPRFVKSCSKDPQYFIVLAFIAYIIAIFILGMSSHTFWRGFSTSNLNTLRLVVMLLAYTYITNMRNVSSEKF